MDKLLYGSVWLINTYWKWKYTLKMSSFCVLIANENKGIEPGLELGWA